MGSRGVIYCATSNIAYLEAALISAIALRQYEPNLPITVVSDQAILVDLPLYDALYNHGITPHIVTLDQDHAFGSRSIKTRLNHFSPYTETLFLDGDILPLQSIAALWDALSQSDFAMVPDRLPTLELCDHIGVAEKQYTLAQLPGDTVQFNSGVMVWRDSATTRMLFEQWYQEWQRFQKQDQLALVRAIHTTQTVITPLPRTYNISPLDAAALPPDADQVHLLHYWGGRVTSGAFRRFAQTHYPKVVATVIQLLEAAYDSSYPNFFPIEQKLGDVM
jgi:Glycosyl transferase family 8